MAALTPFVPSGPRPVQVVNAQVSKTFGSHQLSYSTNADRTINAKKSSEAFGFSSLAVGVAGFSLYASGTRKKQCSMKSKVQFSSIQGCIGASICRQAGDATATSSQPGRSAHWVIRSSDLTKSTSFLLGVFGMHILRHEENEAKCSVGCNGDYNKPWSKTMVGFGPEDQGYCLEITYTYGVKKYEPGSGLSHIAVGVPDVSRAIEAAEKMGYAVDGDIITGPDGYRFRVLEHRPERKERFRYVALRTSNLEAALKFYTEKLGMVELQMDSSPRATDIDGLNAGYVLGFGREEEVELVLVEDLKSPKKKIRDWEGRNAISLPMQLLMPSYENIQGGARDQGFVLHRMQDVPLVNGDQSKPEDILKLAVVCDPEGRELCLVSSETFDRATGAAYDPNSTIDWAWRKQREEDESA
eukprot:TRINITY_DN69652_c0_g1_i1.p1 TRINITY_DN69652_c0_g1~~TRINITY_DN69652_c0_g1_i1.p1  ORF type:complete len:413 (+),score=62.70 TRINITY_DN69652_c0_g1_i1:39-1277(+)